MAPLLYVVAPVTQDGRSSLFQSDKYAFVIAVGDRRQAALVRRDCFSLCLYCFSYSSLLQLQSLRKCIQIIIPRITLCMALALLLCNIIVCTPPQRWPVDCSGHWWPHFSHLLMLEHHLHCISQGRFFCAKKIE